MSTDLFKWMAQAVIDGDDDSAEDLARQALDAGSQTLGRATPAPTIPRRKTRCRQISSNGWLKP